jgi:hypothetical protein
MTVADRERLAKIETQVEQVLSAVNETLELVRGRFPDDTRVQAAVEQFIGVSLSEERAA